MNPLNDERLRLNQVFVDLINDYDNENPLSYNEVIDSKALFKYIWHKGYMLVPKDGSIY